TKSLPSRNTAHVGQVVRDALVAIDAGLLTGEQETLVRLDRARTLPRGVHRVGAMAISALQGIVRLHPSPFVDRQFKAMAQEFLARIDCPEELSPHFLRCLHLASDLVGPCMGHMTVGTMGA